MAVFLNHLLSVMLLVPLGGALTILLAARDDRPALARWIALVSTLLSCACAAALWIVYDPDGKTWQFAERYNWGASIGASLYFGVDGTSILLLVLTSLIALVGVVASWNETTARAGHVYALLLLAETGIFGVYVALDLLAFFLCWQIALLALHGLARESTTTAPRPPGFLPTALGVAFFMLAGMAALYIAEGTSQYSSDITLLHTGTLSLAVQAWVFVALALAFAATLSIVPLHRWIVDAQSGRSTATSLLVAAVLTKMGAYGVFRLVLPVVPDASHQFASVVAGLAMAAVVSAGFLAWRQQDLSRRMAYATASHAGVMIVGLFALTPAGLAASIVQQFGHAIWIAGGMVCAAILYQRSGVRDVRGLDGLRKTDALLAVLLCLFVLAGIRFSNTLGIVGDAWGIRGGVAVARAWPIAAAASLVLTLAYMLPLLRRALSGETGDRDGRRRRLSARELMILVPLVALAASAAVYPKPLLERIEPSVSRVVVRIHPELAPYLRLGSDCPTAAPADPAGPPPGFMLVQPCAEGQ